MHGRFSIIGGTCPGCPPKVYAYAYRGTRSTGDLNKDGFLMTYLMRWSMRQKAVERFGSGKESNTDWMYFCFASGSERPLWMKATHNKITSIMHKNLFV